jgi:hypothetical protein
VADGLSIQVEGLDKLMKKINAVEGGKYVTHALTAGGERVKNKAGKYPPAGDWNNPSARNWYERGFGSHWRTKDGAIHGAKTSKNLKDHWYVKPDQYTVTVGNPVPYAIYVHGDNKQPKFHKDHGWKKLGETAKQQADEILKDMKAAFVQAWTKAH